MDLALCAKIEEIKRISGSKLGALRGCDPCVLAHDTLDYNTLEG